MHHHLQPRRRSSRPADLTSSVWVLALGLTLGAAGCSDDDAGPELESCVTQAFEAQPTRRFAVGSTHWLPRFDETRSECAQLQWSLDAAPENNANEIVAGADGIHRFTPHLAGAYRFSAGEGLELELSVVDTDAIPFHNSNLFPTNSVASVGEEIWVANVMTPTLSVLDAASLERVAQLPVGAWPVALAPVPGRDWVVVAQRGADTLGLVDQESRRIIDAIWVGDEPASVVVDPAGTRAFVALPYQSAVAVVDLERRERVGLIEAGFDVTHLALSPSGDRLYAASRRSGQTQRFPYGDDPVALERDLLIIDTESLEVESVVEDVGSTLGGLLVSADGNTLWLAGLRNDTSVGLADEEAPSFIYEVRAFNAMTGEAIASADLSRQPSSTGAFVSPGGMVEADGHLWIVSEGNDALVALDPVTLEEELRTVSEGRPRALTSDGTRLFVHGHQGVMITAVGFDGVVEATGITDEDPRPQAVATGQAFFTGAGRTYGTTWSCNGCHVDGLTDTLVWNAGPVENRVVPRPFFWTQGTSPLGWAGYLSTIENYAYTVTGNVGIRPTTQEATTLGAYLGSIMPPAAANHLTERDGSWSSDAMEAEALYAEACASCHPLPLTTSQRSLAEGITPGLSDIPALVGAYRNGAWLKTGEATSLEAAVAAAAEAFHETPLTSEEVEALTRYLGALTARDFFALRSFPAKGELAFGVDQALTLDLSMPVWSADENLAHIQLLDAAGEPVEVRVRVDEEDARHLVVEPSAMLEFESDYTLVVGEGLESWDERSFFAERSTSFRTAAAPGMELEGEYAFVVRAPTLNPLEQTWDEENTSISRARVFATPTPSGADIVVDYGLDLERALHVVMSGETLHLPPLPVAIGPSFADFRPESASMLPIDEGLEASGRGSFSGPGFVFDEVQWSLEPPTPPGECEEGSEGVLAVEIEIDANGRMVFDWASEDPALAAWVTDPSANIPAGPTPVTGGETYWSVSHPGAPDEGFEGPVTYGVTPAGAVEDTDKHGGEFRNLVVGQCYKVSVATTAFELGSLIFRWDP